MNVGEITKTLTSLLEPSGISNIAQMVTQLLILINHLTKDDPVKEAKARREIALAFENLIKEVRDEKDATDIARRFTHLLDES